MESPDLSLPFVPIGRCVNPSDATRDLPLPTLLCKDFALVVWNMLFPSAWTVGATRATQSRPIRLFLPQHAEVDSLISHAGRRPHD